MNTDRRVILYVGAPDAATSMATALEQRGWYVYGATEAHEALALYTFYWPHAVIIDAGYDSATTETAYFHLASINAPVLILADRSDTHEIVAAVHSLLSERTHQQTPLELVS